MTEQYPGRDTGPTGGRPTTAVAGKRAGSRKAETPPRRTGRTVLLYAAGVTLAVVAWGYLVWAAIDFGSSARDGDGRSWFFLGLAALGAVACLFAGLMLVARLARSLGLLADPAASAAPPRHGGRRASR